MAQGIADPLCDPGSEHEITLQDIMHEMESLKCIMQKSVQRPTEVFTRQMAQLETSKPWDIKIGHNLRESLIDASYVMVTTS